MKVRQYIKKEDMRALLTNGLRRWQVVQGLPDDAVLVHAFVDPEHLILDWFTNEELPPEFQSVEMGRIETEVVVDFDVNVNVND